MSPSVNLQNLKSRSKANDNSHGFKASVIRFHFDHSVSLPTNILIFIHRISIVFKIYNMSFQYDAFPNQQGQQDASGARPGASQEQQDAMGGPMPDNSVAQFQGANNGDPGSAGGQQQVGDAKTTLW